MGWNPSWSPDGNHIAFVDDDVRLRIVDLTTKKIETIDVGGINLERTSIEIKWSPDSNWIAYAKSGDNMLRQIYLWSTETKESTSITDPFADSFSPTWDLNKKQYLNKEEFNEYVYGSADVVGLMCLKVFVKGNQKQYNELKPYAMSLGSAFQKVNFLRDLKADHDGLNRSYFPNLNIEKFDEESKKIILNEINKDFSHALKGIFLLPSSARFGVYTAYKYYLKLLNKLRNTNPLKIKSTRIRVPNYQKINVLARSYIRYRLNIL